MSTRADRLLRCVRQVAAQAGPEPDDAGLLTRFLTGRDPAAFEALVVRHGPMVLRVCRHVLGNRHDAEDAFQATFLVLARKASSVRPPGALAGWLHGVACRIALGARAAARRQFRERLGPGLAPPDPRPDPLAELTAREALRILEEEVQRLPEAYRLPVVLCCLHGVSQEEAARQLGSTPGSVKGRLERGRKHLHRRLTRRGLGLAAALALAEVSRGTAAGLDAGLAAATAKAAVAFASKSTAGACLVPATVAALAEAGVRHMALAKLFGLLLLLSVAAVAAGLALSANPRPAGEPAEAQPAAEAGPSAPGSPSTKGQARTDRYGDPLPAEAVARLGSLRFYDGNPIYRVVFSPDGKRIVSVGSGGQRLWDTATGRDLPMKIMGAGFFAAGGKLLATSGDPNDPTLWDVATGQAQARLPAEATRAPHVLSPDGKTLAYQHRATFPGGKTGPTLLFCDVGTGKIADPIDLGGSELREMLFSADGKTLVAPDRRNAIHVFDVARRVSLRTSPARAADFSGPVALSPDGKTLAAAPPRGNAIRLWDVGTFRELPALERQPQECPRSLSISPDGKLLAATYPYPMIRLWDLAGRKEVRHILAQAFSAVFSADGKTLAGGDDASVQLWDVATGQFRHDFGHTYAIDAVAFSPDGKRLASGACYTDTILRVWDPLTGKNTAQLRGHALGIEAVAYSPDGKLLASGSQDGTVRLWDPASGKEVRRLDAKDDMVYAMAFTPDGTTIATGGRRKAIHLWDVATGREVRSFDNPGGFVLRLAFSPDGKTIATLASDEAFVRLWDAATGKELRRLTTGTTRRSACLAFSPDGRELASGDDAGAVHIWDAQTGTERRTTAPLGGPVFALAFSPDGRSLAGGFEGATVQVWEVASGQRRIRWHHAGVGVVCSVAFSPDGTLLASGGRDRVAMVWDVTGRRTTTKPRPAGLTPEKFNALWNDLRDADAAKAFQAERALLGTGELVVPFLKDRLLPAASIDPERMDRLLTDLDSDKFAVREKAAREVEAMGDATEPALRKVLSGKPSSEVRRRVEELLGKFDPANSPEQLRGVRALEVLEGVGTPQAKELLTELAQGATKARLTREAKAALQRLGRPQPGVRTSGARR
jgi:RNA polymerase sigma factor (sigma-70 family)